MGRNIAFTLAFNLPSEVEKRVKSCYELNDRKDFEHYIIDLGFPIHEDKLPENVYQSKKINTQAFQQMASDYGSRYLSMMNIGVSQNHSNFYRFINLQKDDVAVTVEPDEDITGQGWIKAMCDVMRADPKYGVVSLIIPAHFQVINENNHREKKLNGVRVWDIIGTLNWGTIAISGKLYNDMRGIPYINSAPVYGYLESALLEHMKHLDYKWCKLPDYTSTHTDDVKLLRQWKDDLIFGEYKGKQISFEDWINKKISA